MDLKVFLIVYSQVGYELEDYIFLNCWYTAGCGHVIYIT